jgi:hypothetical protein
MKKLLCAKLAGIITLIILFLLLILHILILFKFIPSDFVWGGQLDSDQSSMFTFEIIALIVTIIFIFLTAVRIGYIKITKFKLFISIGIWFMFAYFVLNTIGNLASNVCMEKLIFTPITIVLSLCTLRLAISKE